MEVLMNTFHEPDEKGRMKITGSKGDKTPIKIAKLPHTPPMEKIVLPNGKIINSPLRFKSEKQRADELEAFSKHFKYRGN
jgi:hypothetical protein